MASNEGPSAAYRATRRLWIKLSSDFDRILRSGTRSNSKYFSIYFRSTSLGHPRLGVGIGRRVTRKATRRNRIKRSIKEAFRHRALDLPSIDIVVLAKPSCGMLSNKQLNAAAAAWIAALIIDAEDRLKTGYRSAN